MQKFVQDQSAAIKDAALGIADQMGRHVPPDVLGQQVIRHIRNEDDTITKTVIQPLYNQIAADLQYQALPNGATRGGLLVDQKPVKALFQQEVLDLERTSKAQNQPDLLKSPAYLSMKRLMALPDDGQWVDAHTVLKEVRKDLRDLNNPTNVATEVLKDKSVLTRAEKALEQQLETALKTSSDPAHQVDLGLWQQAQKEVRTKNERLRNEVTLRFVKAIEEHGGEKGLKQFVTTMTPDDMTKVMGATKSDPALQGSLRHTYLQTKIEQVGGLEDSDKLMNADKLREAIFGKTGMDRRKADVLLDPQQQAKLKEFINAVSDVQNAPQSMLGKYLMLKNGGAVFSIPTAAAGALGLGAVYNAGSGDTGKAAAELGAAATIVLAPKVLAGMLTDPRKVEFLIQGLRYGITDRSNVLRVTRELIRLDQNFARAVQMGVSAYNAEQTSGPLHRTAETAKKFTTQTLMPQFGLGNYQP
jgi:hypothetical protein